MTTKKKILVPFRESNEDLAVYSTCYFVQTRCQNCNHRNTVTVKKGILKSDCKTPPCKECGCDSVSIL